MVQPLLQTTPGSRGKRTRQLPSPLTGAQQTVLLKWLKSDAQERSWQSLLQVADSSHLEVADALLQALLLCGAVALKEELHHGQWRPWRVVWTDLEGLQTLAGVPTRTQREADKANLATDLQSLAQLHPWLAVAAHSVLTDALPGTSRATRAELLQALVVWQQAQRQGMRQDFALAARGHTKAITNTEWDWLEATVPLETLGIGRFEPLIWLAGSIALGVAAEPNGLQASWAALGFVGVPCRSLAAGLQVTHAPKAYWLIENRASFERQSARLPQGTCLVWLPGRPSAAWLQAMRYVLSQAPAPASISCDPDPAGIQIALTAGALWDEAGVAWQVGHMAADIWRAGITLPLNDYDRRVLAELQAGPALPPDLAALRDYLLASGIKAEQEGWL
jgi:hypothetical protein